MALFFCHGNLLRNINDCIRLWWLKPVSTIWRVCLNRPFPSSCLPPLQSEFKCEVFVMVISSTLHMNENKFS